MSDKHPLNQAQKNPNGVAYPDKMDWSFLDRFIREPNRSAFVSGEVTFQNRRALVDDVMAEERKAIQSENVNRNRKRRKWKAENFGEPGQGELQAGAFASLSRPLTNRAGGSRVDGADVTQLGGEDRLEITLYVRWTAWETLRQRFERAKLAAEAAAHTPDAETCQAEIVDGWVMDHRGFKMGDKNKRGPVIRYYMQGEGCEIGVMNAETYSGTAPNVKIIMGSIALMQSGVAALWAMLKEQIADWDGEIERVRLSRVDACADRVGLDAQIITRRFVDRLWVARARKAEPHISYDLPEYMRDEHDQPDEGVREAKFNMEGVRMTGFALGKGIRLSVYDKLLETKGDPEKRAVLVFQRWGGTVPKLATRVEFQLRRSYLKEMGVHTVEQWIEKRAQVLHYLCTKWIRFTETEPDRKNRHQGDAITWSEWETITQQFQTWAGGSPDQKPISRTKIKAVDNKQMRAQQAGINASIYAYSEAPDLKPLTLKEKLFFHAVDSFGRWLDGVDELKLSAKLERRRAQFLASKPMD